MPRSRREKPHVAPPGALAILLPSRAWWSHGPLRRARTRRWAREMVRSGRGREASAIASDAGDQVVLDAPAAEYEALLAEQSAAVEARRK
jgi:hypothetical protein